MDEKTSELFCAVNPNIDELVEEQNEIIDGEEDMNYIQEPVKGKTTEKSIFDPLPLKREDKDIVKVGDKEVKVFKKPSMSREQKRLEKEAKKEEERLQKEKERAERREATAQRNRERARARYYKNKEIMDKVKTEIPEKIVKDTSVPSRFPKKEPAMDFNTFAEYMLKYENMKLSYQENENKKKRLEKEKEQKQQPQPQQQSYHPANYPLANVYDPRRRYSNAFPQHQFY